MTARESMTAKLCSYARAYHSMLGKNKIFDDYLAYDMIGKEEYEKIQGQLQTGIWNDVEPRYGFESMHIFEEMDQYFSPVALSREAFTDRALRRFARGRANCQYVICGAGMDTFAFRNTDEAMEIFELDHPSTQSYKLNRIHQLKWQIPANVHFTAVDFESDDLAAALLHSGFRAYTESFFSLLGVAYYLTREAFQNFVRSISLLAAPGSQFILDFPDETSQLEQAPERVRKLMAITETFGEPMQQGFSLDEMREILRAEGFIIRVHESPEIIQRHYFDGRTDNQQAMEHVHYLLAEKVGH